MSKQICDSLRSNTKYVLCEKFERLLVRRYLSNPVADGNNPMNHNIVGMRAEHPSEEMAIRRLIADGTIRLSVSDKGGEFVVMPQSLDREITEIHLSDTTIYRRVTE